MQERDFSKVPNSTGWEVVHDPDTSMYYLKNTNGNRRPGVYTMRVMAEKALYDYLDKNGKAQEKINKAKEKAKAVA
jgi:hypothetical protein